MCPTIEPDIRGAKTIRDQLEKHRASATCRSCHRQIDPPGFALESFDAIGRWRGHYQRGSAVVPVDASGQFGAEKFTDITGFKKALLARRDEFARCLVEKLLIHALGRELDVLDRPGDPADRRGLGGRWIPLAHADFAVRGERGFSTQMKAHRLFASRARVARRTEPSPQDVSKLTALTPAQAAELRRETQGRARARTLSPSSRRRSPRRWPGTQGELSLDGLTALSPEAAAALANTRALPHFGYADLSLGGLETAFSRDAPRRSPRTRARCHCKALTTLDSVPLAKKLAAQWGELQLNGLTIAFAGDRRHSRHE